MIDGSTCFLTRLDEGVAEIPKIQLLYGKWIVLSSWLMNNTVK